jgi:NAD(P)-dependent dehydrogenase (short-subunit alcohol dehydrogenase family)
MDLQNKTAVVTGGAKGIGQSTVMVLLEHGARVAVLDTDEKAGAALVEQSGGRAVFFKCDVSNGRAVAERFAQVVKTHGDIDILVNNAGVNLYGTVTETSEQLWDTVLSVNLKSAFLCAKYAIPSMQRRGGGVVINVSSVQAFLSQNKVAAYTASKSALLGLTRSIAVDYGPQIRCIAVCPGTIDTPMLRDAINQSPDPQAVLRECNEMHVLKRIGRPQEVAELIVFLCTDKAPFITGQAIRIDGGLGITLLGSKRDDTDTGGQ